MLRVGLVGLGDAGRHHAGALAALAKVGSLSWTAICSRDEARRAEFRSANAVPENVRDFASIDELLRSERVDAVVLATPDGLHAEQVEAAVAAGKHVLVEKPFALTRADGERALAAARTANVHVAVGYHLRHHAAHRLARQRMDELVGKLRAIHVRWAWPDPATDGWRARGDGARFWSLAALGTHAIDLALFFGDSGGDVGRVASLREPAVGVDRAAEVSFSLGDAIAHVSVAVTHRAMSRIVLTGDIGELEAIATLGAYGEGELFVRSPRGAATPIAFTHEPPYVAQLLAFVTGTSGGFREDSSHLQNLSVLDSIP
ncbi:hypothetical protein BH09MYX1_BH09MYX1_22970 [soil metagenome]